MLSLTFIMRAPIDDEVAADVVVALDKAQPRIVGTNKCTKTSSDRRSNPRSCKGVNRSTVYEEINFELYVAARLARQKSFDQVYTLIDTVNDVKSPPLPTTTNESTSCIMHDYQL